MSQSSFESYRSRLRQFLAALPRLVGVGFTAVVLLLPSSAAAAPVVIPPNSGGANYATLSAAWWQYTLSFPASTSPFFDATGANCALGQAQSSVFFLVGSLSRAPVKRDQCVAPAGKSLFFPVLNTVDVNTAHQTPDELRAEIKPVEDGASGLYASIDKADLSYFRTQSIVFNLKLPDGNLFGLPAGNYSPAVADGYYVLLAPLPPGQYKIGFGGTDANGFSQNITYNLTVK